MKRSLLLVLVSPLHLFPRLISVVCVDSSFMNSLIVTILKEGCPIVFLNSCFPKVEFINERNMENTHVMKLQTYWVSSSAFFQSCSISVPFLFNFCSIFVQFLFNSRSISVPFLFNFRSNAIPILFNWTEMEWKLNKKQMSWPNVLVPTSIDKIA